VPERTFTYNFRGNFTNLGAGLTTMGKGVGDLGTKLTALDRQGSASRRGLTQLGSTAGKAGLLAAAGVGAIVLSAANFDQAMSRVQAATGSTADGLDDLRAAAIQAGQATVFSATEAADAITAMAKAGVSQADILAGGLTGALNLASAGELDVAQAADIAATAMNQFGLAGKDIPHIADLLAEGAASAQGEVTDFATALKYVGPVAHQMGISIEETTGVIAELASQGVLADQAGTSLRGMLTALTSPSVMAKKQMAALGIQLYDTSGQFIGFDGVAGQLHDTLGGLTNAERDQALGRIFGNEQITAARILYAGGADAVAKWTDAVDKDGAAADIAATKLNNLKGDLEQLRGSLETALIGSGEGSQGGLRTLVQDATKAVNAFNQLPGPIKSSVTALGGLTAVTGGSLWFGAKVISGIASTKQALKDLGDTGVKLQGVLRGVGIAAGTLAVLETVGATVDALEKHFDKALPSTSRR
jgi:TP901 family phage tail tape measure protein